LCRPGLGASAIRFSLAHWQRGHTQKSCDFHICFALRAPQQLRPLCLSRFTTPSNSLLSSLVTVTGYFWGRIAHSFFHNYTRSFNYLPDRVVEPGKGKREMAVIAQQKMIQLCHSSLDSQTLRIELIKHLRTIIPFDYVYFSTTDPATQLSTSAVMVEEVPAWLMPVFIENEFLQEDFNKFNDLLHKQQPVGVLSQITRYDLHRSPRYREMLVPMAMEDELRAIFVTDRACWGTLCLHRGGKGAQYTAAEAHALAQIAPHIADGLRKALLLEHALTSSAPDGPGVLIVADDLSLIAATEAAEYWLMELKETGHFLPLAVRSVIAGLKAIENGIGTNTMPKIRLRTRSGHWLILYASRLKSAENSQQISVIFEKAQPTEIAPLIIQAYLLTKREAEVTACVLQGWSTGEIATRLHISPNTVQDHLKTIFAKVDVSSRGELAARIFIQQHQPHFAAILP
jgi:DNA-binding CsgD family transcriptional regulator